MFSKINKQKKKKGLGRFHNLVSNLLRESIIIYDLVIGITWITLFLGPKSCKLYEIFLRFSRS